MWSVLNSKVSFKVEYVESGHVAIRLDGGFEVPENKVLKKINNDDRFKSNYESIKAYVPWFIIIYNL